MVRTEIKIISVKNNSDRLIDVAGDKFNYFVKLASKKRKSIIIDQIMTYNSETCETIKEKKWG